ncbi:MAG: hypothetical protein K2G25_05890, partial [Oscillospiraceae bacterium]|nr:hypothetical protein [Oscillospiraceae bacterium]
MNEEMENDLSFDDDLGGGFSDGLDDFDDFLDFDDDDPLNATVVSRKSLVIFFLIDTSGSMKGTKMGE